MLHIIALGPSRTDMLQELQLCIAPADTVLLVEDGVYSAGQGRLPNEFRNALPGVHWFALSADLSARGMLDGLADGVEAIDYGGFVDLVANHDQNLSWY